MLPKFVTMEYIRFEGREPSAAFPTAAKSPASAHTRSSNQWKNIYYLHYQLIHMQTYMQYMHPLLYQELSYKVTPQMQHYLQLYKWHHP